MTEPDTPRDLFDLADRVAIVTGASGGLGARFARVLSRAGAHVVLAARRADRIEALASELPGAIAVPTDLTDDAAVESLVAMTIENFGRIDVLVNNAGAVDEGTAFELGADAFRAVMEVNLVAPFLLARAAARHMAQEDGGSIINVASINGFVASRSWPETSYAASKGGLVNLTRELANQWAKSGIRVNALAPGFFPTEMTADLLDTERGHEWVAKNTPMRRPGLEHELDGALLFLASGASTYVTGQLIVVDGGYTAI
jgi:NAD(P)-dependent dehydrogenase (short-subunit alcohol dehydrogenase family)